MPKLFDTGSTLPVDSSEPTEECKRSLDQMLALSENALKRWTFDAYNSQLANARSYMWISTALLAAHVGLFKMLTVDDFQEKLLVLIPLAIAAIAAVCVFRVSSTVAFGNYSAEVVTGSSSLFAHKYESGGESGKRLYEYKINLLNAINRAAILAVASSNIRGRKLRASGRCLEVSFLASVLSLIAFFVVS